MRVGMRAILLLSACGALGACASTGYDCDRERQACLAKCEAGNDVAEGNCRYQCEENARYCHRRPDIYGGLSRGDAAVAFVEGAADRNCSDV